MTDKALLEAMDKYLDALRNEGQVRDLMAHASERVANAAREYDLQRERSERRMQLPEVPVDN